LFFAGPAKKAKTMPATKISKSKNIKVLSLPVLDDDNAEDDDDGDESVDFSNMVFCVTGTLTKTRKEIETLIQKAGASVSGTVTS
jgi:NAD-dependent DNA ligase